MAPGRRKKKGERRMDAALDAMIMMGFERNAIKRKVNELLEVYGGSDGWVFIEEASYKLLIEGLVDGQEGSGPGPPMLTGGSANQDNMLGDAGSSSAAGPLNTTDTISPLMDTGKTCADGNSHQDSALTSADDVSFPEQIDHSPPLSPLEIRHTPLPPLLPPPPPPLPPESDYLPPPPPPTPAASSTPSSQKRRPCHGWWGDETDEIICLPMMPVPPRRAGLRPVNAR